MQTKHLSPLLLEYKYEKIWAAWRGERQEGVFTYPKPRGICGNCLLKYLPPHTNYCHIVNRIPWKNLVHWFIPNLKASMLNWKPLSEIRVYNLAKRGMIRWNPLSDERWQERLRLKRAPSQISDKINIRTIKLNWKIPIKWGHFLVNKNNLLYLFLDEKVCPKIGKWFKETWATNKFLLINEWASFLFTINLAKRRCVKKWKGNLGLSGLLCCLKSHLAPIDTK